MDLGKGTKGKQTRTQISHWPLERLLDLTLLPSASCAYAPTLLCASSLAQARNPHRFMGRAAKITRWLGDGCQVFTMLREI
jgi:hypothetical protein